jgi:imidazolonepropionase-like amidohydrolase
MRRRTALFVLSILMCACKPAEESHMKAIIGAVLIDGQGGPPLSDSVVVVAGDQIREAGLRSTVAIPEEADKVDGSGKFLVPAPLDVYPSVEEAHLNHVTHLSKVDRPAISLARDIGHPVIGHVSTEAAVRAFVDAGAAGFVGMITDTEELDPALLARLRDLRISFAPALTGGSASLDVARRNTRRLFSAGVPIALASNGGDPGREPGLLVEAGIPPLDVIVAATRNSAAALGILNETGTIQAGKRADLLLLSASPGEDIANLRKVVLRMSGGNWVK